MILLNVDNDEHAVVFEAVDQGLQTALESRILLGAGRILVNKIIDYEL